MCCVPSFPTRSIHLGQRGSEVQILAPRPINFLQSSQLAALLRRCRARCCDTVPPPSPLPPALFPPKVNIAGGSRQRPRHGIHRPQVASGTCGATDWEQQKHSGVPFRNLGAENAKKCTCAGIGIMRIAVKPTKRKSWLGLFGRGETLKRLVSRCLGPAYAVRQRRFCPKPDHWFHRLQDRGCG